MGGIRLQGALFRGGDCGIVQTIVLMAMKMAGRLRGPASVDGTLVHMSAYFAASQEIHDTQQNDGTQERDQQRGQAEVVAIDGARAKQGRQQPHPTHKLKPAAQQKAVKLKVDQQLLALIQQ